MKVHCLVALVGLWLGSCDGQQVTRLVSFLVGSRGAAPNRVNNNLRPGGVRFNRQPNRPLFVPNLSSTDELRRNNNFFLKKREAEGPRPEDFFLRASIQDGDDCLKKYTCISATKSEEDLTDFEKHLRNVLATSMDEIDVNINSVEFDLASVIGTLGGSNRCEVIYARCSSTYTEQESLLVAQWKSLDVPPGVESLN